jgi:hypothetical protein
MVVASESGSSVFKRVAIAFYIAAGGAITGLAVRGACRDCNKYPCKSPKSRMR